MKKLAVPDKKICVACGVCMKACPAGCIAINNKNPESVRVLTTPIPGSSCVFVVRVNAIGFRMPEKRHIGSMAFFQSGFDPIEKSAMEVCAGSAGPPI